MGQWHGPRTCLRTVIVVFEDLEVPPASVLTDALSTIAAAGAHQSGTDPRAWKTPVELLPCPALPVHELPYEVANDNSAAVLEFIRHRPGVPRPLEVSISHRHIILDADHGLGDAGSSTSSARCSRILDAAFPWVMRRDSRLALPRALVHTFAAHPSRARTALQRATALGSSDADDSVATSAESAPWSLSFAVAVAHVNADIESEVESWRRANADNSGRSNLGVHRAAGVVGGGRSDDRPGHGRLRLSPLPTPRTNVQRQFRGWPGVSLAVNATLPEVNTRLKEITVSAVPLLGMEGSARTLLRAGRKPSTTPDKPPSWCALPPLCIPTSGTLRR